MQIVLTPQEAETFFHTALCHGLGYIRDYGIEVSYDKRSYQAARSRLQKRSKDPLCSEDVLLELLRGGDRLEIIDHELAGTYTCSIGLAEVHERVALTPTRFLLEMIEERDDAETADALLQTVFFKEVLFG